MKTRLTAQEIADQLYTIGYRVVKSDISGWEKPDYKILVDRELIEQVTGAKGLKEWFIKEQLDQEYESIIKEHGIKARKVDDFDLDGRRR
jgi:hypothetical protein